MIRKVKQKLSSLTYRMEEQINLNTIIKTNPYSENFKLLFYVLIIKKYTLSQKCIDI